MKRNFSSIFWIISIPAGLSFWYIPYRTPLYERWGDVVRGWPLGYGLDQGDVRGDGYAFMVTYFHPIPFVIDGLFAMAIGLLFAILGNWIKDYANKSKLSHERSQRA